MHRRQFLAGSMASSAFALSTHAIAQAAAAPAREFYLLRRYTLRAGPQTALAESYFGNALIPALARMAMKPAGALRLEIGPETPAFYLLIPGDSADALAQLDLHLTQDAEFMSAAAPFWSAPAGAAAFERIDSSLLIAFEGWPRLTPPPASAAKSKRIFQLRTYESPSHQDHVRKVEMFHSGEFEIFRNAGFHMVFFGDTLIGARMPSLTYMVSFADTEELNAKWDVFRNDPAWKKLSAAPRFSYEQIVSNITNLVLSPLSCSSI